MATFTCSARFVDFDQRTRGYLNTIIKGIRLFVLNKIVPKYQEVNVRVLIQIRLELRHRTNAALLLIRLSTLQSTISASKQGPEASAVYVYTKALNTYLYSFSLQLLDSRI